MKIELIDKGHEPWESVQEYAQQCSWTAGKSLVHDMKHRNFQGWERKSFIKNLDIYLVQMNILVRECR